jgi:hypothetical protein
LSPHLPRTLALDRKTRSSHIKQKGLTGRSALFVCSTVKMEPDKYPVIGHFPLKSYSGNNAPKVQLPIIKNLLYKK